MTFPEKPKRKRRAKSSKTRKIDNEIKKTDLVSVICPECQGSGVDIGKEDDLEKPVIPLSKVVLCYFFSYSNLINYFLKVLTGLLCDYNFLLMWTFHLSDVPLQS